MKNIIDKLKNGIFPDKEEFVYFLSCEDEDTISYLHDAARQKSLEVFGSKVYIRGLIEFTNYCKNDCFYCGIRNSNKNVRRYRLTNDDILECASSGYSLGFRTFVLQGGEDTGFTDEELCKVIYKLKSVYPDCAVTLSVGERTYNVYKSFFDSGCDRYLLRHETANCEHYKKLHPPALSSENRKQCLYNLKSIGFQTGTGFMVGSPFQTNENLYEDFKFIYELRPHMVGIGPYIVHKDTPFKNMKSGSLTKTLICISLLRLILPNLLIPSTTALGTISPNGREDGILSGANVVMPNLSPKKVRKDYQLYDNKICTGEEASECIGCMKRRMEKIGYQISVDRGDYPNFKRKNT